MTIIKRATDILRPFVDGDAVFPRASREAQLAAAWLFCLLVLCFANLGAYVLPQLDDLTHACMGVSILQTGDWFTMHEGRLVSWLKPPLYFWLEAAAFKLFSVSEYWAKFPAAVCGFLTFLLVHKTVKLIYGARRAFLAVFVLSTSLFFLRYTQRVMMDMPAACVLTLSVYAALRAVRGDDRYFLLYGLSLALGYYFKALQGMYALAIIPVFLVLTGRWKKLFSPYFLAALAGALALIAAWAVPQYLAHGREFLDSQCGIGPLTAGGLPGYTNPFYRPLKEMFRIFYWSAPAFYGMWLSAARLRDPAEREGGILLLLWFWVIMAALSVSSVFGVRYLVPALVPAAIFAAAALDRLIKAAVYPWFQHLACLCFACITLLTVLLPMPAPKGPSEYISLYRCVERVAAPKDRVVLFKGLVYIFNQGLTFYSGRPLDSQVLSPGELAGQKAEGGRVLVIAAPADYSGLQREIPARRVKEFASADNWVLFQLLDQ